MFLNAKLRVWALPKVSDQESNTVKLATWEASVGVVKFGLEKRAVKGCEVTAKGAMEVEG